MDENKQKNNHFFMIIPLIIMITAAWFYLGSNKVDMFVDEVITYVVSNDSIGVTFRDTPKNIDDKLYTKQDLVNFLAVNSNTRFNFKNVCENYEKDVHPPFYGLLLNVASSFYPYNFSKWMGLTINLILYLLTVLFVFLTADKLFKNSKTAVIATYVYGMSFHGLSAMLLIRMYILLTLLTILLAYEILCFIENGKPYMYPIIGGTVFLGLMTQYTYVYYAFFLCLTVLIYLIIVKEYKKAVWFSISAFAGVVLMLLIWTPFFEDIKGQQLSSGHTLFKNAINIPAWIVRMKSYYVFLIQDSNIVVPMALISVFTAMFKIKSISKLKEYKKIWLKLIMLIIPAYLTYSIIAISSPAIYEQYLYHISIFRIFAFCTAVYICEILYEDKGTSSIMKKLTVLIVIIATIPSFFHHKSHWLYQELYQDNPSYLEVLSPYTESPCLCIDSVIEHEYVSLMKFNDIFVTGDIVSGKGMEYIEDHNKNENLVVFYRENAPVYKNGFKQGKEICDILELKTGYAYKQTLIHNIGDGTDVYLFVKH